MSVAAGDHILFARSPLAMENYFGLCFIYFDHVLEAGSNISQNGNDAIELYEHNQVIETFNETILSGQEASFTFENTYDFSVVGEYQITAGSSLTNDEETTNDSITVSLISQELPDCPDNYELPIVWRDYFECYDPFIISEIGDWIIYDPKFDKNTILLWLIPLILFIFGGLLIFRKVIIIK